jgi:hypothetical protein
MSDASTQCSPQPDERHSMRSVGALHSLQPAERHDVSSPGLKLLVPSISRICLTTCSTAAVSSPHQRNRRCLSRSQLCLPTPARQLPPQLTSPRWTPRTRRPPRNRRLPRMHATRIRQSTTPARQLPTQHTVQCSSSSVSSSHSSVQACTCILCHPCPPHTSDPSSIRGERFAVFGSQAGTVALRILLRNRAA